jgi:hypothetical protein
MKKQTHSSKAYSKRNIKDTVHPSFPIESDVQNAHMGSQSAVPPQQEGYDMPDPNIPSQDMSFGRTN